MNQVLVLLRGRGVNGQLHGEISSLHSVSCRVSPNACAPYLISFNISPDQSPDEDKTGCSQAAASAKSSMKLSKTTNASP